MSGTEQVPALNENAGEVASNGQVRNRYDILMDQIITNGFRANPGLRDIVAELIRRGVLQQMLEERRQASGASQNEAEGA